MTKFSKLRDANRRWTILELLKGDRGHQIEAALIAKGIESLNRTHAVTVDQIRKDLRWLAQHLLIDIEVDDESGYVYGQILDRGVLAANGKLEIEGVDFPTME